MNVASLKLLTRRPPVIVAGLVVVTVLAFLGVNRLVNRFREQEKALARHLYEHGMQAQSAGQPEGAARRLFAPRSAMLATTLSISSAWRGRCATPDAPPSPKPISSACGSARRRKAP